MAKKKKQVPQGKKGLRVTQNKMFYGVFTLLFAGLLVIGSTFAWISWSGWEKNHFQGDPDLLTPHVNVIGNLNSQVLTHQENLNRQIKVTNSGELPVFVRVELTEALVSFEVDVTDQSGNGHLKEYASVPDGSSLLQPDILSTWQPNYFFKPANKANFFKTLRRDDYSYKRSEIGRPELLTSVQLRWGNVEPSPAPVSGYWLYEETAGKGYYYYSDILPTGGTTVPLVTTTELLADAPNPIKGSLYQLNVSAVGGEAMSGIYGEWNIPENASNKIYNRYQAMLSQQ